METFSTKIVDIIYAAAIKIKEQVTKKRLIVSTKSSRSDFVTNVDTQIQDFIMEELLRVERGIKFLAEENNLSSLPDFSGKVAIIDPIDGTNNMVLENKNFCIMVAIYDNHEGKLGYIYDVMADNLLWGGPDVGIHFNDKKLKRTNNVELSEGLVGFNSAIYRRNAFHAHKIGDESLGIRMTGCAGLELMNLALGNRVAYISNLQPWDYAAGKIILETLGLRVTNIYGNDLKFNERELFIAATPLAHQRILEIMHAE